MCGWVMSAILMHGVCGGGGGAGWGGGGGEQGCLREEEERGGGVKTGSGRGKGVCERGVDVAAGKTSAIVSALAVVGK